MRSLRREIQDDHAQIRRLLKAVQGIAGAYHSGRPVEPADVEACMDALDVVAERRHRRRERDAIFPALRKADRRRAAPVLERLEASHREEVALWARMRQWAPAAEAGEVRAQVEWGKAASALCHAYEAQLRQENRDLVPLCDQLLGRKDKEASLRRMAAIDAKAGPVAAPLRVADGLAARYARYAVAA